jgi:hypothetical protein
MPKVIDTRKVRAAKLLERIVRGPSFNPTIGEPLTTEEAQRLYSVWMQSWILQDLKDLVPELREESQRMKRTEAKELVIELRKPR